MTNALFSSWLNRIPFGVLLGIATSVELFQARLLKSTCLCLYGDQFDVEQSTSVVEKLTKTAVAHLDAPLRLGPSFMQSLLERQQDQVAGIPMFVSSLKVTPRLLQVWLLDIILTWLVRIHVSLLRKSIKCIVI